MTDLVGKVGDTNAIDERSCGHICFKDVNDYEQKCKASQNGLTMGLFGDVCALWLHLDSQLLLPSSSVLHDVTEAETT